MAYNVMVRATANAMTEQPANDYGTHIRVILGLSLVSVALSVVLLIVAVYLNTNRDALLLREQQLSLLLLETSNELGIKIQALEAHVDAPAHDQANIYLNDVSRRLVKLEAWRKRQSDAETNDQWEDEAGQ